MKPVTYGTLFLGLLSSALAQTTSLGPSPTESVGCVPHNDHWDCEGPAVTSTGTTVVISTVTSATTTATETHHDHDHDEDGEDEHTDEAGTGSLAPSPTESVGCEPHGDHWHCEGPASATQSGSGAVTTTGTVTTTAPGNAAVTSTSSPTGAAVRHEATGMAIAGLVAVAALAL